VHLAENAGENHDISLEEFFHTQTGWPYWHVTFPVLWFVISGFCLLFGWKKYAFLCILEASFRQYCFYIFRVWGGGHGTVLTNNYKFPGWLCTALRFPNRVSSVLPDVVNALQWHCHFYFHSKIAKKLIK